MRGPIGVGASLWKLRVDQGLERGPVAHEAEITVEYLKRLEEGRIRYVSPLMVGAVTRAIVRLVQQRPAEDRTTA